MYERAVYRIRQLVRSLRPRVRVSERDEAHRVLGQHLYPLFASMHEADQRHCLDVYRHLVANGCPDAEMLQAALLHDAGKGRIAGAQFGLHHRVAYVVLERVPGALDRLASWNRGLRSLREHDRRTIELAREYGASAGVVRLLQAIEGLADDPRATALKAADDQL